MMIRLSLLGLRVCYMINTLLINRKQIDQDYIFYLSNPLKVKNTSGNEDVKEIWSIETFCVTQNYIRKYLY